MAPRGCGDRIPGGVYAIVPKGPGGRPIEEFLFCPPQPVPQIGLSAEGQTLIQTEGGPTYMWDWISGSYYPNVCDWIEEGRFMGLSFRIAPQNALKLKGLTFAIPVHPKGFILNWKEYRGRHIDTCPGCRPRKEGDLSRHRLGWGVDYEQDWYDELYPRVKEAYAHELCSGYWWQDVRVNSTPLTDGEQLGQWARVRPVQREMPGFEYEAHTTVLATGVTPQYEPAAIGRFPVKYLEVITGSEKTEENLRFLKGANLPVYEVEE